MKSLSEKYSASHSNSHETFADLMFCALVVLILFVLALTIEVSQRVRSTLAKVQPVEQFKAEELSRMSAQEVQELANRLQQQQAEIKLLQQQLASNNTQVQQKLSALAGEQCFTGAREPAAIHIAYDYRYALYYFIPAKDLNHADRSQSGETVFESIARKRLELARIAVASRSSRGFTLAEVRKIYSAMSKYAQVVPTESGYSLESEDVGLYYHTLLCEYIAGDVSSEVDHESVVVDAILKMKDRVGTASEEMYPRCVIQVDVPTQQVAIGGVRMNPRELLSILLSLDGRGLMLDFEGYTGKVPAWLYEKVLAPAGYISKTPKLPDNTPEF